MRRFLIALLVSSLVVLGGCATKTSHYEPIEKNAEQRKFSKTVDLVKKEKGGAYEEKDRVLYSLELGLAYHYANQYESSNDRLARADEYMDELFTKSLSNMGYSFLTNSTELPYRGEPHENIYLNTIKALNYSNMDDNQAVGVEVRKLDNKLGRMETRFKRMAEDYQESTLSTLSDTSLMGEKTKFEAGENKFHTSAFGRYLGYISYLSQDDLDDARIDLEKINEAFANQPGIYNFEAPDLPRKPVRDPDRARVHAITLLGKGPKKVQETKRLTYKDIYVKWAYPVLKKRGTTIDRVSVRRNGQEVATLQKLEDVNEVSEAIFNVKKPIIMTYNFVRALSKALATREAAEESGNQLAGVAASIATQEFTENADLRVTRLLPGEVHVGHFTVPEGEPVQLKVAYYSNGKKVSDDTIQKTFEHGGLNVLETYNYN